MLFEKIHLEESENLVALVRKHWFVITIELLGVVLLALMPLILLMVTAYTPALTAALPATFFQAPVVVFSYSLWLVFSSIVAMITWTHYYLDLWIITDRRIIVVEQLSLWHRTVGNFRLERLQDIQVSVSGIIPTLLNFGTVHAQTASAAESNFSTTSLPDPRGLQSTIQQAMDSRLQALRHTAPPTQL